jgi:hypothetical protein
MSSASFVDQVIVVFFEHQLRLKMLHFQSNYYGAHKAIDTYLTKFLLTSDQFVEAAQGIYGKTKMDILSIPVFKTLSDESVPQYLTTFVELLQSFNLGSNYDLTTIRDQMMIDVNQLKYLLTFR